MAASPARQPRSPCARPGSKPPCTRPIRPPRTAVGGMLTLAPNGLAALQAIGAADGVERIGLPMARMVMADGRGRLLGSIPALTGLPPALAMTRPDLYRFLRDQAVAHGITIEAGKRLVQVEQQPDGVIAQFEDGSTAQADVLIGADGTHSTVRGLIDPGRPAARHRAAAELRRGGGHFGGGGTGHHVLRVRPAGVPRLLGPARRPHRLVRQPARGPPDDAEPGPPAARRALAAGAARRLLGGRPRRRPGRPHQRRPADRPRLDRDPGQRAALVPRPDGAGR